MILESRRRCASLKTMMWSKHSRRIDPINRSAKPFCQGDSRCGRLVSDAHSAKSACDYGAVDPIAVPDHVTRSLSPREGLSYLTCNPLRCRAGCDVDPDEISAIKPHNHEGVK